MIATSATSQNWKKKQTPFDSVVYNPQNNYTSLNPENSAWSNYQVM